jgi:hypothetical protein
MPVWLLCALLLASLLLGYGGAATVLGLRDALVVARDAQAHATVLEALLKGGGLTQVETLHAMQTQLRAIDRDLRLVRADLPVEPVLARLPGASGAVHGLLLATDLVEAGELGVDAALALVPHLKALLSSVGGVATPSSGSGPPTLAEIRRAAADVDAAGRLAVAALGERAQVGDGDLRALGLGRLIPRLHQLDGVAPQLPTYLGDAHTALAALPALLGLPRPINFLLFDLDSDELRATGGFQGVYGVLTFSKGALASGVHLTDIYALDCAGGYCPTRWVPGRFAWFDTDPAQFALRDANQDPDYPTTARFDEQLFAQEGGPPVAGVISITPAFVEQILRLTGPISVPQFGQTVTADNLQELIHHYHAAAAVAGNDATRKVFDADAGAALLKAVATLTPAQQGQLVQRALKDLRTRDIQVYLNDARLEGVLGALGADGALLAPKGDALAVVDTNVGSTYANANVRETVADAVSLDDRGTATHDLTITYDLPAVPHAYPRVLSTIYVDVLRVIVPAGARLSALGGCDPVTTTQAGHAVWACRFVLRATGSVRVRLRWTVPRATTRVAGATQYGLLLQRQAGARDDLTVTIAPPRGSTPAPSTPQQARYSGILSEDQSLTIRYTP